MNPKAAEVLRGLEEAGFQGRIVPAQRIADVGVEIQSLKEKCLLDQEFYDIYISKYKYGLQDALPTAKSLIVVAVPTSALSLTFCYEGKKHRCLVPPTYANAVDIDKKVRSILERVLAEGNVLKALLPYKTLATRTGLARYGKNNIAYSEEFGSYHRLTGFFTEVDLETDHWQEMEVMTRCTDCNLCQRACPTGAIPKDRFLLMADRCLTFHNELPSERAFSSSIKPSFHHALLGCMRCQDACPMNRGNLGSVVEGDVYTEPETDYLLKGDYQNEDAEEIMEKLDRSGLDLTIFPRNLVALLAANRDRE
jgi:epoxyqueuosine reductase